MIDDNDPTETREWLDSLDSVVRESGDSRARYLMMQLAKRAVDTGVPLPPSITTPFRNTISPEDEKPMPGDLFMERRIRSLVRWNALAMVMRANDNDDGLGGHISSFSSSATLYDVGCNYFFRGTEDGHPGDLVFYQGHSAPGMYARSYLEGRLSEEQLDNFRREVDGKGLSSYPHPWLMPDYWQFPTVSMGLGPIQAIYQARVMKYQSDRGLLDQKDRNVWCFMGDGECDEPESLGAISLAGRERLGNLIFVVNCNLQRLDGPVRGNGKIIQELEGVFRGAGWDCLKVIWGRKWDPLLERDESGMLQKRMDEVCDGELQNYKYNGGAYTREHFFGKYPESLELVKDLSDDDIMYLNRGGHDPYKVYAAYAQAAGQFERPTVILAMTVKGYGTGEAGEASNETHSLKKLDMEALKSFRDRFAIPIDDDDLASVPYYKPDENSPEMRYMRERRRELGGCVPARRSEAQVLPVPGLDAFSSQTKSSGDRQVSTTMAFVRMLSTLAKDKAIGHRVVPIVPDEARTFGMEGMFRQLGIYSSVGQRYTPHDADQIMFYKEDIKGQILEEGINEAGAGSAWLAAATSYSTSNYPMVPFYIFYSMFGFQRIGDLLWAAGDSQARGFLIGATSGRTTLNGEGLQHQDGHSHLLAATIPNCVSYDPTYAYELAVIIQDGMRRMYSERENRFYYITTMNENYPQPAMPDGVEAGIVRGMYRLKSADGDAPRLRLCGAGSILREVEAAAEILRSDYGVDAEVWSLPSINELQRDSKQVDRWNMLHPGEAPRTAFFTEQLQGSDAPVVIATDYMKSFAEQLRAACPAPLYVLGTDGFGRSDTRARLRHFFEVSREFVVLASLSALAARGEFSAEDVAAARDALGIDPNKVDPTTI
ncbi:pyruvate dehydrogenase (acetyl-transferring), homodimeric type [Congregibacter litoralis]|uniref:Pyruvate dehydrogenase E1 component n=1 Tax=Congregibacter litoralis KT71 TaxID=314285 RepID=A4A5N7_9GAMM|nr:pyruvate dehydrogenase (acetyl-transferring), homodimeric type [Congregibacter litoralis]EAQ98334.1 pyruvate dehydrogenase E1 component, homodimeric type [Congregibacter litoralis KT71]